VHRHAKLVTLSASVAVVAGGCLVTAFIAAGATPGPIVAAEVSAPTATSSPAPSTAAGTAAPAPLTPLGRAASPAPSSVPAAAAPSAPLAAFASAAPAPAPALPVIDPVVARAARGVTSAYRVRTPHRADAAPAPRRMARTARHAGEPTDRASVSAHRVPAGPARHAAPTAPTRVASARAASRAPATEAHARPTAGREKPVTHRAERGGSPQGYRR
jgi:hypothetical protein